MKKSLVGLAVILCLGLVMLGVSSAQHKSPFEDVTEGALRAIVGEGEEQKILDFPLKHTEVEAEISGLVARVKVTQHYLNPYQEKIEAVYVFLLPQDSAVNDMTMKIGDRTIRGLIKKREEARQIYKEAKKAGHVASLLEQERPNIWLFGICRDRPVIENMYNLF